MSSSSFLDKRVPTIFALLILVGIVGATLSLTQSPLKIMGQASIDAKPQNIIITNVTESSFTISFTTPTEAKAFAELDQGKGIFLDDRDKKDGMQHTHTPHYITAVNLDPNTSYTFSLMVNGNKYSSSEMKAATGSKLSQNPSMQEEISGEIILPDGQKARDSVIVASIPGAKPISVLSDSNGNFKMTSYYIRSSDGKNYFGLEDDSRITFRIFNKNLESNVESIYKNAKNLPIITLGSNYSFLNIGEEAKFPPSSFETIITTPSGELGRTKN